MTRGRKTGGRDFLPANPGGPGRPELPVVVKEARRLTKTEFECVVNKYLWMPLTELAAAKDNKNLAAFEVWMAAIIFKGLSTGDWSGNEWIQQRLLGKVKDQVEITQPKPFVINYLDGTKTELGAKIEKEEE